MNTIIERNHAVITEWIAEKSRVLDLGCGNGDLLTSLIRHKKVGGIGVEIAPERITECIKKGLCVYQSDLDQGLSTIDDMTFDYVILNATLQSIYRPYQVIEEMLRVGRFAIISISNFGYIRNRLNVLLHGRASEHIRFSGSWHNTQAIRFVSISEFTNSLKDMGIEVVDAHFALPFGLGGKNIMGKDLLVKEALFQLRRS